MSKYWKTTFQAGLMLPMSCYKSNLFH